MIHSLLERHEKHAFTEHSQQSASLLVSLIMACPVRCHNMSSVHVHVHVTSCHVMSCQQRTSQYYVVSDVGGSKKKLSTCIREKPDSSFGFNAFL